MENIDVQFFGSNKILNNRLPEIPKEYTNSFMVFHVVNEKIIRNTNDLDYGLISNITPFWWSNLVLYENTNNERYLIGLKNHIKNTKLLVVFYPELLLNLQQQRQIQEILLKLDYDGNILMKTNSPFIIQACKSHSDYPKTMVYLGSFKDN